MSKVGIVVRTQENGVYGVYLVSPGFEKGTLVDLDIKTIRDSNLKLLNAKLERGDNGSGIKLVGTNGSLTRYAKPIDGKFVDYNIVVLGELFDAESGEAVGYRVCTPNGKVLSYSKDKVLKLTKVLTEKYGKLKDFTPVANGKIVTKDGAEFISSIKGNYPSIKISNAQTKNKEDNNESLSERDLKVLVAAVKEARLNYVTERAVQKLREYNFGQVDLANHGYVKGEQKRYMGNYNSDMDTFVLFLKKDTKAASTILNDLRYTKSLKEMSSKIIIYKGGKVSYIKEDGSQVTVKKYNNWKSNRPKLKM